MNITNFYLVMAAIAAVMSAEAIVAHEESRKRNWPAMWWVAVATAFVGLAAIEISAGNL